MTDAHDQKVTNTYVIAYPEHEPREQDPHYKDFHAWKAAQKAAGKWRCAFAVEIDDDSECDLTAPLEAHHSHIEFALSNAVDLAHLEHLYPGVSNPDEVGAWIETGQNLALYCRRHHRAADAGVHHLDAALFEASKFLKPGTVRPSAPHAPAQGSPLSPPDGTG